MKTTTQPIDTAEIFTRNGVVACRKPFPCGPASMHEASGAYAGDFGPSWTPANEDQTRKFNAARKRIATAQRRAKV